MSGLGPLPDKFTIALPLHKDYVSCKSDGEYIYVNYTQFDDASTPDPLGGIRFRPFSILGEVIHIKGDGIKLPADVKEERRSSTYPCTKTVEETVGFAPLKFKVKKNVNDMCAKESVKYTVSFSNKYLSVKISTKERELFGEDKQEYERDPIKFRRKTLGDAWWRSECLINGYWLFKAEKLVSPSGRFVRINVEPLAIDDIDNAKPDYVLVDVVIPDRDVNCNYYSVDVQLDGGSALIEVFKVRHWWRYNLYTSLDTFYGNYHILILAKLGSKFFTRAWFEDHYVFDYEIDTSTIPPTITKLGD